MAERRHAIGEFLDSHGGEMDPTVSAIIRGADHYSATQTFDAFYRLKEHSVAAMHQWALMDVLLLPTTGTIYTIAEVKADPIVLNSRLGLYTNFVNLLDLSAVAVPAGISENGLPFGVTVMAPALSDRALLGFADKVHRLVGCDIGVTGVSIESQPTPPAAGETPKEVLLAVVGAHLTGQPLNWQLTQRGGRLIETTRTAPNYRLFSLANTIPPKPGLVRTRESHGEGIELEVWALSECAFGSLVSEVPSPMVIGTVTLADGKCVKGFLCEPQALEGATEITHFGGWRAFLKSRALSA